MSRGSWKSLFSPESRGAVVEYCRKYTVGHGVGRGSRPGYRLGLCGDRAGVLPALAGGMVVAIGCTVFQTWRDGAPWALQVRVLRAPAARGDPGPPLNGVLAHVLGGPGDTRSSRTPRGGGPRLRLRVLSVPP